MAQAGGIVRAAITEGIGIHSGRASRVTLSPSSAGGIRFLDTNGCGGLVEELRIADTARCTGVMLPGGTLIHTVEHLLAALSILRVTDIDITVEGNELPILDGSSLPWLRLLHEAGASPAPSVKALAILRPFRFEVGGSRYAVWPGPRSVSAAVSYPGTPIGFQSALSGESGLEGLAAARTFAMASEVAVLKASGLASGGSLENALVIGPEGPINPGGYRLPDEPARHKTLDLLGDLMLAGRPIEGRVEAFRPGHAANRAFLAAMSDAGIIGDRRGTACAA